MASGDDPAAGLDHDFVILDAVVEIFEFGGEAGPGFAALLGDREVSQDVAAGVSHQAGEVHQEVVGGCFGSSSGYRGLYLTSEIYLSYYKENLMKQTRRRHICVARVDLTNMRSRRRFVADRVVLLEQEGIVALSVCS